MPEVATPVKVFTFLISSPADLIWPHLVLVFPRTNTGAVALQRSTGHVASGADIETTITAAGPRRLGGVAPSLLKQTNRRVTLPRPAERCEDLCAVFTDVGFAG